MIRRRTTSALATSALLIPAAVAVATVFRPAGADAEDPVLMVLETHDWGGSRATTPSGAVAPLPGRRLRHGTPGGTRRGRTVVSGPDR